MKYAFIINPAAGKKSAFDLYGERIQSFCKANELDCEILLTERTGHATEMAARLAGAATPENPVRIFSVGGDGTLSEVVRGLHGYDNVELGCLPCGSGNDYARAFGKREEFLDIERYIVSPSILVDTIKAGNEIAINLCSMGFDAMIANTANIFKLKHKRWSGPKAYNKAIAKCLMGKLYNKLKVTVDDNETFEGKYMFSLAASGQYYGSGFHAAPMADPSDGLLDFVLIKKVSHLRAIMLIGQYKNGTYVTSRAFRKILTVRRGTKMTIESKRAVILNIDGECKTISKISFEVIPGSVRFIVPPGYITDK